MTKLRKITGILPLMVAGLLFSIVVSVFALQFDGVYIGKIEVSFDANTKQEYLYLELYSDPNLQQHRGRGNIYTGPGVSEGQPIGLIATAVQAQAQRTKVNITTQNYSDYYRILKISQIEKPDDVFSMLDNTNMATVDGNITSASTQLTGRGSMITQIKNQQNIAVTTAGIVKNNVDNQGTTINSLNNEMGSTSIALADSNLQADNQITKLSALTADSNTILSMTNSINSNIIVIGQNVATFDPLWTSEADYIINQLNWENNKLYRIFSKLGGRLGGGGGGPRRIPVD